MDLELIVKQFAGVWVLIVGDLMLDKYIWGEVARISPEAPVQVVNVHRESWSLGGSANTAANTGALGGRSVLVGVMGGDSSRQRLTKLLAAQRTDVSQVIADENKPTTQKVRIIARNQQLLRFDYEDSGCLSQKDEARAIRAIDETIRAVQVVVISDYAKGFVTPSLVDAVTDVAKSEGVPVLIDPKPGRDASYHNATLLTPNSSEALQLAGMSADGDVVAAGHVADQARRDDAPYSHAGPRSLRCDRCRGYGNCSAGALPWSRGNTAKTQLWSQITLQGKCVVTANSSFDLLHAGHVRFLEQAGVSVSHSGANSNR
ncbi:MAG TPA: hypothetical protein ENI68_08230 [Gammaproteobacteria bacterium]|nr:hypothetical protein [Gammaproteobacteria bacterium]